MPIPSPKKGETEAKFTDRCMGNATMKKEYSDGEQRFAVCMGSWRKAKKIKKANMFNYKGIVFMEAFSSLKKGLEDAAFKRFGKDSWVRDFSDKEVIVVQYNVPGETERNRYWKIGFKFKKGEVTLGSSAQEVDVVTSYEQEMNVSNLINLVDIEIQLKRGKDGKK